MDVLVQDAIESLKKHPRITNVHARVQTQGQDVVVSADIDTNLASTWKALGRSPNGVLPIETVEIVFPSNYPQGAPIPTLRADFDASLPHVNPHDKGERVPPCIYQGTLLDALHSEGFERLIVQLVDWLERAAEGTLINESQGWEPARRAIREHVVDFDVEELEKQMPRLGGLQLLTMFQVWKMTGEQSYACSPQPYSSTKFTGSHLRALLEHTHAAAAHFSGRTLLAICWPSRGFDGVVTPYARYQSDTASSMQEIAARADEYGCNLALQRFRKEFSSAAQYLRFACNFPVYIALAVKRPHHLIGMTTDYEFLVYRLLVPIPQGMDGVDVKAIPVPILSPVSTALLRRTSAIPNDVTGLRSSYLGCGSLGSKVIMHVARAGFAPELVIDHGYFRPHNAARHVLMPNDVFSAGTKADKLAALVNQLAPANATKPYGQEVQAIPLDGRTDYGVVLDPNAVLVNTTGSARCVTFLPAQRFAPAR
jgi:Prokaryotic E2 family A